MKKYIKVLTIVCVLGVCICICYKVFPNSINELESRLLYQNVLNNEKYIKDVVSQEGNYYIYLFKDDCPYCENINHDIDQFSKSTNVVMVNTDYLKDLSEYDWNRHELENDILIGEKTTDNKVYYYDNLTEEDIKKNYPEQEYKIVCASQMYTDTHDGKQKNKIYAISTHPLLLDSDFVEGNYVIPGVPMLIEINNHKMVNYYFDDKEIINFLHSDTKPVDVYWNIDY